MVLPRHQWITNRERMKRIRQLLRNLSPRKSRKASLPSKLLWQLRWLPASCVIGAGAITTLIALLGPLLIPIFSSRAFLGYEHLLWYLGASAGLFCVAQQLVLPGLRMNRPAVYMPAKLIHSVLLLGLSFVLVPRWGIDGMGIASFVSSAGYLSAMTLANVWLKRTSKAVGAGVVQA